MVHLSLLHRVRTPRRRRETPATEPSLRAEMGDRKRAGPPPNRDRRRHRDDAWPGAGLRRGKTRAMDVNPIELQKHLKGVDYPASRDELVSAAESNGAPDEVIEALRSASQETFDAPTAVQSALS